MDKYIKTSWIWSPDSEIERVVHASLVLASGFYARKGFVVLPRIVGVGGVVLPDLEYERITDYWQRVSEVNNQFPIKMPEKLRSEVGKLVSQEIKISEKVLKRNRGDWEKVESELWRQLRLVMPEEIKLIGELEVRVTNWGTASSCRYLTKKKDQKLIVYLRSDMGMAELAEAVITALLWPYRDERGLTWSKREAIVDFLMTRGEMKRLFPKYRATLEGLREVTRRERGESEEYVKKLGVPRKEYEVEIVDGVIMVKGEVCEEMWGGKEREVLVKLIEKRGEILSFDEIADMLWGEGEFRTFWAINKMMQRMRNKLREVGMEKGRLVTKRGRGYVLV